MYNYVSLLNDQGCKGLKLRSKLFYSYVAFLVVYGGFTLLPKPSTAMLALYHVSSLSLRIIDCTIFLLLGCIWYIGFYGYAKLRDYALLVQSNKDGEQIARLTKGILLLVMWLPVSSTISSVLSYFAMRYLSWLPAVVITENYIKLLLPLIAFVWIGTGAYGLSRLVRQRHGYVSINVLVILLLYIGFIYYHLIATIPNRISVYHMSIWPILLTLIAPYVYMWFVGLLATYDIYRYSQKVGGLVYRKSWRHVGLGTGWLIVLSMCLQYLTTLSGHLSHLSIYALLAIIYSLLLVLSVGFVFIAIGARKLKRIEEV